MDISERRARIREILGLQAISHGQVYTCQIAIPVNEQKNISSDRLQIIEDSLIQHKSNLIPLIVRRTEAYSEDEEFEVVYGADWCLVAKELDIEKLWVWVFDMTDEQAVAAKEEMQQLMDINNNIPEVFPSNTDKKQSDKQIEEKQINELYSQIAYLTKHIEKISKFLKEIEVIFRKVEQLDTSIKKLELQKNQAIKIDDSTIQQLTESIKAIVEDSVIKKNKTKSSLSTLTKVQLKEMAKKQGIIVTTKMNKNDIISALEKSEDS
ncbi:hypothetical protein H6G06_25195 [Anabaena sphaerica FACHB-251]|uniref:Rho termination factor N-terminal domain-containing protein n=1 Tax=Anabaena sphaerica FACHB-251 TaxID=2692883 RepID=A0A926WL70_9NOST|nr:hypothetical protein [Anabaena sphaerica]MBD2296688.1 hypothetical protein [Anabaena sphaerica FACHB-251]